MRNYGSIGRFERNGTSPALLVGDCGKLGQGVLSEFVGACGETTSSKSEDGMTRIWGVRERSAQLWLHRLFERNGTPPPLLVGDCDKLGQGVLSKFVGACGETTSSKYEDGMTRMWGVRDRSAQFGSIDGLSETVLPPPCSLGIAAS